MKNIAKEEFLIISQFFDPITNFDCIGSHILGEYGKPWGPNSYFSELAKFDEF